MIATKEDAIRVVDEALRDAAAAARLMLKKVKPRGPGRLHEGGYGFGWVEIRPARGKVVSELKRRGIGRTMPGHGLVVHSSDIDGLLDRLRGNQVSSASWLVDAVARSFAIKLREHGVDAKACARGD